MYDPASGNLAKVVAYGPSGKVRQVINYEYVDTDFQSKAKDLYHFNPEVDQLDYYLKFMVLSAPIYPPKSR